MCIDKNNGAVLKLSQDRLILGGRLMSAAQQKVITPKIGEVYYMMFSGIGSEQSGWRPGVVFQNNVGNTYSPNIIALPITTALKKIQQPTHVFLPAIETGLAKDSMVLCENPQKMSKTKIGKLLTKLPDKFMKQIARGSIISSSAISYFTEEEILDIWRKTISLNCVA